MKSKASSSLVLAVCALTAGLLGSPSVHAQTQRSGNDATRVQQQLQQLSAERAQLRAENDAMKKELEALKASQAQLTASNSKLQARSKQLEAASSGRNVSAETEKELESARAQLQQLVTKFRETAQTLREVESERESLRSEQSSMKRDLSGCVDKNAQLYLVGSEILDRVAKRGVWSSASNWEAFTQISRTRLENLAEEYRYRIDELKVSAAGEARVR